jgi:hypothetical protein
MEVEASGWSGDGDFTTRLIEALERLPIRLVKVEDAPASRADSAFIFVSNELFIVFDTEAREVRSHRLGVIPTTKVVHEKVMTLADLEKALAGMPGVGEPDYADEGMLQYLRAERIVPPYQTRGYKMVELVRIYEAGTTPKRD